MAVSAGQFFYVRDFVAYIEQYLAEVHLAAIVSLEGVPLPLHQVQKRERAPPFHPLAPLAQPLFLDVGLCRASYLMDTSHSPICRVCPWYRAHLTICGEAPSQAVAIQCWDSLEQNYGCAPCVTMSMLGDKLIPAACETDIAGAVSMYALTLASGKASALLDWNNNFAEDRNKCVCTHCGNYPKSFVQNDLKLGPLGVLGRTLGKINTFGAVYAKVTSGPFTFFRISTDDPKGCIKAYLGKGEITDDPYGMDGCIAVTKVDNLQQLMKYICKNGFEHHVAMCRTDVVDILNEAIETYLGWNLYVHE